MRRKDKLLNYFKCHADRRENWWWAECNKMSLYFKSCPEKKEEKVQSTLSVLRFFSRAKNFFLRAKNFFLLIPLDLTKRGFRTFFRFFDHDFSYFAQVAYMLHRDGGVTKISPILKFNSKYSLIVKVIRCVNSLWLLKMTWEDFCRVITYFSISMNYISVQKTAITRSPQKVLYKVRPKNRVLYPPTYMRSRLERMRGDWENMRITSIIIILIFTFIILIFSQPPHIRSSQLRIYVGTNNTRFLGLTL